MKFSVKVSQMLTSANVFLFFFFCRQPPETDTLLHCLAISDYKKNNDSIEPYVKWNLTKSHRAYYHQLYCRFVRGKISCTNWTLINIGRASFYMNYFTYTQRQKFFGCDVRVSLVRHGRERNGAGAFAGPSFFSAHWGNLDDTCTEIPYYHVSPISHNRPE